MSLADIGIGVTAMDAFILGAALAGSFGTAWMIQRAILVVFLKAIATHRR